MEQVSTYYKENAKKNLVLHQEQGQGRIGVVLLQTKMGFLRSEKKSTAETLNDQFQSVFTEKNLQD